MRPKYKIEKRVYNFPESREVDMLRTGKYPLPGSRRAKRKKATPEEIKKVNEYNRIRNVRRLIKENFKEEDYWVTFPYVKGCRGDLPEALEDRKKLLRYIRQGYKKKGYELKWIGRTEVGKNGGLHHHMLINRIPDGDIIIRQAWARIARAGHAYFKLAYEKGQFSELASYIVKSDELDKAGNPITKSQYSHSRNLKQPEPEVSRTSLKSVVLYPEPSPGYYIDKDSVCQGINPVTGREYLHYIEIRLKGGGG